jgi:hypothetical protein
MMMKARYFWAFYSLTLFLLFNYHDFSLYTVTFQNQVHQIAISMMKRRIQSILEIAVQTIEQTAGFPLPRSRSLELSYLLERILAWKPPEPYKHDLISHIKSLLLSLWHYASKDWIWTKDLYRCLDIISSS